jgi:hypothetical protein
MPDSLSAFVQRAGRAARRPGSSGLAVLIVEPSAFETDVFTIAADPPSQPSGKQKKSAGARPKKERTAYAQLHGLRRGWRSGKWDHIQALNQPSINHDAEDEGLHAFVQTGLCRRRVTKVIYDDPSTREFSACVSQMKSSPSSRRAPVMLRCLSPRALEQDPPRPEAAIVPRSPSQDRGLLEGDVFSHPSLEGRHLRGSVRAHHDQRGRVHGGRAYRTTCLCRPH